MDASGSRDDAGFQQNADMSFGEKASRGRGWLWAVMIAGLVGGGGWFWVSRGGSGAPPAPPESPGTPVELLRVTSDVIQTTTDAVGSLEAAERVALRPEVEGRLVQVLVRSGDRVAAGTPLIQLKPDRTQAEANAAAASIALSQARRKSAEASILTLVAEREAARAEVVLQEEELKRTTLLVEEGAQSQQALDRVTSSRNAAAAALNAAEQRIQAARTELVEIDAAIAQAEANAAATQTDLSDYRVVAPIAGTVGDIPVKVGDYVETGDVLTTLTQNQTLELRLTLPLERSLELREGLAVELYVPQIEEPIARGAISFVSPTVDPDSQVILTKARFANLDGRLRDGQFVEARVIWREQPGVLVPTTAIAYIAGQAFVYVAQPAPPDVDPEGAQQIAEQRPLTLGEIRGNQYQVLEGLQPGESIVTSGVLNLTNGVPIVPDIEPVSMGTPETTE
ncbi:MAG: efflux RND transporter periplasmic adaptor subunit [Cyanobacteria bacterium P01_D01_bin.123]